MQGLPEEFGDSHAFSEPLHSKRLLVPMGWLVELVYPHGRELHRSKTLRNGETRGKGVSQEVCLNISEYFRGKPPSASIVYHTPCALSRVYSAFFEKFF